MPRRALWLWLIHVSFASACVGLIQKITSAQIMVGTSSQRCCSCSASVVRHNRTSCVVCVSRDRAFCPTVPPRCEHGRSSAAFRLRIDVPISTIRFVGYVDRAYVCTSRPLQNQMNTRMQQDRRRRIKSELPNFKQHPRRKKPISSLDFSSQSLSASSIRTEKRHAVKIAVEAAKERLKNR